MTAGHTKQDVMLPVTSVMGAFRIFFKFNTLIYEHKNKKIRQEFNIDIEKGWTQKLPNI